jgi:hypothetical protein
MTQRPPSSPPNSPGPEIQSPPQSDSESDDSDDLLEDAQEYQFDSDREERLAASAQSLLEEADGNYRCKSSFSLIIPTADLTLI